ncbi:EAL domain-containing protein [Halopseudomonas pelagia]|uniref:Diguanylate phosphodiesterase n=1 Tax=Halopseudomonas pelagia TaxID=553151 RepID=A0AA91Z4G5_9GAMM|nr:EAL domain-containing protein [Halopseudomonas pelagia]PCC97575.1 diguanylate phosphodiesterase [Halopseudomonas pelagia]QFY57890.1 EAL domain-containing protein [Halopseudomonas pelagia]
MTLNEQHQALLSILREEAVSVLFQPIVSMVQQRIVGYEALSRGPSNSSLHSPLTLFATARQCGLLTELEMLCRRKAVIAFSRMQLPGSLFLNVSPESLLEKQHYPGRTLAMLKSCGMTPDQVVIELTEQAPIDDFALLQGALVHYREMGFRIALDDLGAGYSSLRLWSELRPDFVKIDRHFIDGIHLDPLKREFVGSILNLAKASQAHIIAEGIEQTEELQVLEEMGVDWVQGYWLGRPETQPVACQKAMQAHLASRDAEQIPEPQQALDSLLIVVPGVHQSETVSQVLARFHQQASLNSLAILNDAHEPVGTVHCHSLSQTMLKPFATELHGRKPISHLMDRDYLAVDVQQSLERVSRLLTSRARQRMEEDFIILRDGKYAGLGRVIDVLRHITELKLRQARHANPLTLLPGNIPIQECLARLLAHGQAARLCYIDLDAFKPFNDIYGYGKGDEVLLGLAQILKSLCDPRCDFVGHIGGDDFMLVLRSADWRERLQLLDQRFQQLCGVFYRPEHLAADGFSAPDRHGQWRHHGLLQLSVGVVFLPASGHGITDPGQLAEMASHAKHEAKKITGFSVVCENLVTIKPGLESNQASG